MSEMNETDHALTLCIKKLSNDWEEKKPYALQWRQAYYAAGRISLVFSDENPERQITIRKEEPQITVIKTTSGFKIESNVDTNKIEGNYMVKREKETLIKIIELRNFQRDIILILNRISIFPLQAEKQLTEVLQELNKNFIIHSDLPA